MGDSQTFHENVTRSESRKRKKAAGRAKVYRIMAAVLIIAGLGMLAYTGYERLMVGYRQSRLLEEFEQIEATAGFRNLFQGPEDKPLVIELTEWQPMRLIIPAIGVELACVGDGDVFDHALLDQGPTHFHMSDLPSTEGGNVAFAGHRAGRWNFFLDIDQLEEGDEIYLDIQDGYRFIYHVEWVEVFDKYDWGPIHSTDYPAITLQTCEPKHVSNPDYRLMARGRLAEVIEIPPGAPAVN